MLTETKKRKESEPYVDVDGLEDERSEVMSEEEEEEEAAAKKWMRSMMQELKQRRDDVSDFEQSMTAVQLEMKEVKLNMNKVAEALFQDIRRQSHERSEI